jgi:hypothetical protein
MPTPPPPDVEPPPGSATDPGKAEPVKDEQWWRDRVSTVREAIDNGVAAEAAIQSRINQLQSDAVNIDDPAQQARARAELGNTLLDLRAATELTEKARRDLAGIQEDARRLNIPPGWIR